MDTTMDTVIDKMSAAANAPPKKINKKNFEKAVENMYEEINFALESDIGRFKTKKVKNEATLLKKQLDDLWHAEWTADVNYRDMLKEIQTKVVGL
jgi:hypothetical protein